MDVVVRAGQLIASLSLLVILHEGGHFIPAKLFGMRVEKFYLFFDAWFSIVKKKIGETEYGIGWIPLGGYVKIAGMVDESMDTESLKKEPQSWEFRAKPAWQRLIVMLGGITVNVILGFLIYIMIVFVWGSDQVTKQDVPQGYAVSQVMKKYGFRDGDIPVGVNGKEIEDTFSVNRMLLLREVREIEVEREGKKISLSLPQDIEYQLFENGQEIAFSPFVSTQIDSVVKAKAADRAGLRKGDKIVKIGDMETPHFALVKEAIEKAKKQNTVEVIIEREGEKKTMEIVLEDGKLGVYAGKPLYKIGVTHREYGLGKAIEKGLSYGYWTLRDYITQFKFMLSKKGASQVGSFISMGKMFAPVWDWQLFWERTAMLSMILAFMNLLPIPALDGGHTVFLLYEVVVRKKPSQRVLEYAQMVGIAILLTLMIYAIGNDIYRFVFN